MPAHWLIYFMVDNCTESTEKAKSLGANVLFGPVTMDNVGNFTVLADPQGAAFALFEQTHTT
jgi:predicted enzyme related to lactoylglutathione lyase